MSLSSEVKFLSQFETASLTERSSAEIMTVVGEGSASFASDGSGYDMNRDQYLRLTDIDANITNAFTLGFYLTSSNEGRVKTGYTTTDPVKVSVLDFGVGTGFGGNFAVSRNTLVVHEECLADGLNNRMKFLLYNAAGSLAYEATTTTYTSGVKHHFWFVYDGAGAAVTTYVDGESVSLTTTGSVPASVSLNQAYFAINRYAYTDNNNDLINNEGIINEVVLFNSIKNTASQVASVINNSIDYVVDNSFINFVELDFGLLYDDPSPVKTNDAVISENNTVLAVRSDGTLVEGSKYFWETRREFSNNSELSYLITTSGSAEQDARMLKLTDMAEV